MNGSVALDYTRKTRRCVGPTRAGRLPIVRETAGGRWSAGDSLPGVLPL